MSSHNSESSDLFADSGVDASYETQQILIVEHDAELYGVIQALVTSLGMTPIHAATGEEGLRLFNDVKPLLCLIDVLLPQQNGFDVCKAIKSRPDGEETPIVMMSSLYQNPDEFEEDLASSGADDFIIKPFSVSELREMLVFFTELGEQDIIPIAPETPAPQYDVSSPCVLVAEGDASVNAFITQLLLAQSYQVVQASNGQAMVAEIAAQKPRVCLVDSQLPGLPSLDELKALKASLKRAGGRLIVMAVKDHVGDITIPRDDLLFKPFAATRLTEMLDEHLKLSGDTSLMHETPSGALDLLDHHTKERLEPQGNLEQVSFATIVTTVFLLKLSGRLELVHEMSSREVYFLEGLPVYTRSNVMSEFLGTLLVEVGLMTLEQLKPIVSQNQGAGALGQELIKRGFLTPAQLSELLARQTHQRLLTCFGLRQGEYVFVAGDDFKERIQTFEHSPLELLRESGLRHKSVSELANEFQELGSSHFVVPTQRFQALALHFPVNEKELELLKELDGTQTLSMMLQTSKLEVSELMHLLWGLREAGMVVFSAEPRSGSVGSVLNAVSPRTSASYISRFERQRLQDVLDTYIMLGHVSIFQLLGVSEDVSPDAFKQACDAMMKKFEAKRFEGLPAEYRNKANAIYSAVRSWRRKYASRSVRQNAVVPGGGAPQSSDRAALEASLERARQAMREGRWTQAVERFEQALESSHEDPDVMADYAWALYQLPDAYGVDLDKVENLLKRTLRLDNNHVPALLRQATVDRERGRVQQAVQRLKVVLDLHPGHAEALDALNQLEAQRQLPGIVEVTQRSLWSRLFEEG